MEMIHQSLSYPYCNNYGNYNPHNEKTSFNNNNFDNRVYRTKPIETRYQFSNLVNKNNIKNEVNRNQDLDKNNEVIEFKSGMQDVPTWLKSLRLHKYKLIFSELTYEEMLLLTEKQLEEKNVTKGARHKIIVNIDKLRARQSNVINMEKSVEQEGISGIRQSLNELKNMLLTPIKAFDPDNENKISKNNTEIQEGDIPSQIMRLLEKIFSCIQSEMIRDDEIINLYLVNCEKCLSHDAFTAFHKQRLIKIKSKLEQIRVSNQQLQVKNLENKTNKLKWNNSTMPLNHLQNTNQYKNVTKNNNFQNNHIFNNQLINSTQVNSQHYHHHPYQNSNKFINSNYSSVNSQQNIYPKNHNKNLTHNNLVPSNQPNNNFNISLQNKQNNYNIKLNENNLYNIGVDIYKNIETNNAIENARKSDNKPSLSENLTKFTDVFNYDKQSNQVTNEKLNKIVAPLTSCSLFNACSQIGKLTQVNDENYNNSNHFNYEKSSNYDHLESNLIKQQNNQFVFGNLMQNDNYLTNSNYLKCLDKKNSNLLTNQKFNYETDDFDEKLDENHQIYNHIELLSLRMTEQALGSSDFS